MAQNNNNFQTRISTDRFGNNFQLKTAKVVVNKKNGEVLNVYKAWVELKGQLYKIEVSPRLKETKDGQPAMWVKVTAVKKPTGGGTM